MIIMSLISLLYQLSFIIAPYHNPNNLYKLHINETKEMKKVTNDELSESDEVKPSKKKGNQCYASTGLLALFSKKKYICNTTNKYKQTKIFIIFKQQTRIISDISQHFLTINCFKLILKTNGILNYLCKEIIFVF